MYARVVVLGLCLEALWLHGCIRSGYMFIRHPDQCNRPTRRDPEPDATGRESRVISAKQNNVWGSAYHPPVDGQQQVSSR